jgi:RimJ/RimL family protein N-acetyltransferase
MNFTEDIVLENKRVRLEPLSEIHLNELVPIAVNHPNLLQYSPSPFGTEEFLKENIQKAIKSRVDQQRYPFAIFDKLNNRFIGSTSFGNISIKDKRLEIGWTWIGKESQGTGLNKYCKHLMLSHAFEKLNVQRVEFKTDNRNIQSKKAIEKIGGIFEGILRSHTLMLDGHRRDTAYYSILKSEWTIINNTIFKEIKTEHNNMYSA